MSEQQAAAKYRKPDRPPSPDSPQQIAAWTALIDSSVARVTGTAEKWYAGLAGFIAVITSILIIKGPATVQAISSPWNWIASILSIAALVLMTAGFWTALTAAAPQNPRHQYDSVIARFKTIRAYNLSVAMRSDRLLTSAKRLVMLALISLIGAIATWWLSPQVVPTAPAFMVVSNQSGNHCGELIASDDGYVVLRSPNGKIDEILPLDTIESIRVVEKCI